jgi:hypothetical protein
MILHFSHIGFTDGLTFMFPFGSGSGDPALAAGTAAATASWLSPACASLLAFGQDSGC